MSPLSGRKAGGKKSHYRRKHIHMKRLLTLILCLCLLLSSAASLAEGKSGSADRYNVSDTKAPNIIKFVFDEDGKTLKPGDKLHVKMKLDDQSDITDCHATFWIQPQDLFIRVDMAYDAASDMYKGEYTLQEADVNGTYLFYACSAEDKYGNSIVLLQEKKGFGSFTLKGAIKDINLKGTVSIKENGKTLKPGDEIHITVKLDKAYPNAASMEGSFVRQGDKNPTHYLFDLEKKSSKVFEGTRDFWENNRNGKYSIESVTLFDDKDNVLGVMKVTGQYIIMKGCSDDAVAPRITSVTLQEKGKKLTAGDKLHFSVKARDNSKDQLNVFVKVASTEDNTSYTDPATGIQTYLQKTAKFITLKYKKATGAYEGSLKLPKDLPDGEYFLVIDADDQTGNSTQKEYRNLSFTYTSPDFADKGIKSFITVCWKAFFGKKPTKAEVNEYGTPLASGKKKAVNVINTLLKKSKLSGEDAAVALWQVMRGQNPDDSQKAKTVAALKEGKDVAIDSLNNSAFRKRCKEWGINPGTLGTGKSSTKVASVDVDDGHYTLSGSKATFTGAAKKDIKTLVIKDTVEANGKTYKVTKIDTGACKGLANLTKLTIGRNVTSIGREAFKDCKALKSITISASKLKSIGKDAFSGISKKAVFKLPKKQLSKYRKMIRKDGGAPKNAKFE